MTNSHDPETVARIWAEWEKKPDEWWLGRREAPHAAGLAAAALSEVQGYGNLLWAMPWQIGRVPSHLRLYTSDNPAQGYLRPAHPWWEGGAFASLTYYIPLSPAVLLKVDPLPDRDDRPLGAPGNRVHKDFSGWHVAMALHIISATATRFLYGDCPVIWRDSARRELADYERRAVAAAKQWLGYSDQPPSAKLPRC